MAATTDTTPFGVSEDVCFHTPALQAFDELLSAVCAVTDLHGCILVHARHLDADLSQAMIDRLMLRSDALLQASYKAGSAPRLYRSEDGLIGLGQVSFTLLQSPEPVPHAEFIAGFDGMMQRFELIPRDAASADVRRALEAARPIFIALTTALAQSLPDIPTGYEDPFAGPAPSL